MSTFSIVFTDTQTSNTFKFQLYVLTLTSRTNTNTDYDVQFQAFTRVQKFNDIFYKALQKYEILHKYAVL